MLPYSQAALSEVFQFGYAFHKAGIMLSGIVSASYQQKAIFTEEADEQLAKLTKVVDGINFRHGQVRLASQSFSPDWVIKQQYLSRRYTTQWNEILMVK